MVARRSKSNGDEGFSIEIDPSPRQLAQAYDDLAKKLGDWRPAFRAMLYPVFVRGVERNLATQGGAIGDPWPQLEPLYAKRKRRLGSRLMLKMSGRLRGTLHQTRLTKRLASYGSAQPHARAVQYGKGRIGKRRFIVWNAEMKAKALELMNAHAARLVDEHVRQVQQASRGTA